MDRTIIILSGGGPGPAPGTLPEADFVIAADSGLHLAKGLGLEVDLIVGDLDSARPDIVDRATAAGAAVERHPAAKDATDLELALAAAAGRGATRIVVAGGGSGRLDHLLGLAMLLASDRWSAIEIEWHTADAVIHRITGRCSLATRPGDLISLVPVAGPAAVSITGTRWELNDELLPHGSTRGISNEATGDTVEISVADGIVLAAHNRRDE